MKEVIKYNKELIKKYPWLLPSNRWSGKWITDCMGEDGEEGYWPGEPFEHPDYDYSYTELDEMPKGWRDAFGLQMCEDINNELLTWSEKSRKGFRIMQIKEKFGSLRFYVNAETDNLSKIISKYERMSEFICIKCGKPATWVSIDWISPWCDECSKSNRELSPDSFKPINEWWEYWHGGTTN